MDLWIEGLGVSLNGCGQHYLKFAKYQWFGFVLQCLISLGVLFSDSFCCIYIVFLGYKVTNGFEADSRSYRQFSSDILLKNGLKNTKVYIIFVHDCL